MKTSEIKMMRTMRVMCDSKSRSQRDFMMLTVSLFFPSLLSLSLSLRASLFQLAANSTFEQFNVTHTIHKIRFGEEFPGTANQLDEETRTISDGYGMYQYYFKVRTMCVCAGETISLEIRKV